MPTAHRLSFPTCLSHPGNMHLHCSTVHRLLHFPSRASTTGRIRNSQSSVAVVGLPPGEITSPTNSLTWREFLTGLTTCFFNHGPDNPPLQTTVEKMGKARDDSTITEVHNGQRFNNGGNGSSCVLFSACVNWTRDGKNRENELMRKAMVRMVRMLRERMVRMVRLQNRERARMVRENPHNGGNSHINLHVSWVTLGSPGARSSPLGVCSSPQRNLG
jgi:hypothetical protein